MNCQDFEAIINELARGALMDVRLRERAEGHRADCARCAARLADESELCRGLRALSAGSCAVEAPARVESALLAAFRQHHAGAARMGATESVSRAAAQPVAETATNVVPFKRWSWRGTFGTAATAAAAAAVILFVLLPPLGSTPSTNERRDEPTTESVDNLNAGGAPVSSEVTGAGPRADVTSPGDAAATEKTDSQAAAPVAEPVYRRAASTVAAYDKASVRPEPRAPKARPASREAGRAEEIATDFIPLMNGGQFAPEDGGQLVRVELPRTALASFGLPVNPERAGERVKADVLMGEDGMARAIRFVR